MNQKSNDAGAHLDISADGSNGGYTVAIHVNTPVSTTELRAKLQAAYDAGAAGFFNIEESESGSARRIVFSRSLGDDYEILLGRINAGESADVTACTQLADEFEEHQSGAGCLTAVIAALRDRSNAVVAGLPATRKPLKTYSFNDPGNGIFAQNFRDRDGLKVRDTCIWMLRARLFGRRSREWSEEQHRTLAGMFSSEQIFRFNDAVQRSLEGYRHISECPFWERHAEEGVFFTPEFRGMLPDVTDQQIVNIGNAVGAA